MILNIQLPTAKTETKRATTGL